MKAIIVIPSRWKSSRFIGKPLALINNVPKNHSFNFGKVRKHCEPAWHIYAILINFDKLKITKGKLISF